jgi:hypothetical protein
MTERHKTKIYLSQPPTLTSYGGPRRRRETQREKLFGCKTKNTLFLLCGSSDPKGSGRETGPFFLSQSHPPSLQKAMAGQAEGAENAENEKNIGTQMNTDLLD